MSSKLNGATPLVVAVTVSCGETLLVVPVSQFARQNIVAESEHRYPPPDKTPFQKPIPGAVDPSMTTRAEEDPDYKRLSLRAQLKRNGWQERAEVLMAVKRDEKLIKKYASFRQERLQAAGLAVGDAWEDTLFYCLLLTNDDVKLVMDVAESMKPLTEAEIIDGMRQFRLVVQQQPADAPVREAGAPDLAPAVEEQDHE